MAVESCVWLRLPSTVAAMACCATKSATAIAPSPAASPGLRELHAPRPFLESRAFDFLPPADRPDDPLLDAPADALRVRDRDLLQCVPTPPKDGEGLAADVNPQRCLRSVEPR